MQSMLETSRGQGAENELWTVVKRLRRWWLAENERQKDPWATQPGKTVSQQWIPLSPQVKERISQLAHLGNTMEDKTVENRCPERKLKTSLEITNIEINQLPRWTMSQNYVYIGTTD